MLNLIALGTPMLLMGDKVRHTQLGNNAALGAAVARGGTGARWHRVIDTALQAPEDMVPPEESQSMPEPDARQGVFPQQRWNDDAQPVDPC